MKGIRRSLAFIGAITLVALSCGEPSPLGVDSAVPPVQGDAAVGVGGVAGLLNGLLQCSPLPEASATQTIGPAGGTIVVGPHQLTVPPGALATPVTITAVAPTGTVNSVRFEPSGLVFNQTASLTMSYANCGLVWSLVPKRIAYTTDLLEIISYLVSFDNPIARRVTGRLDHFSTYAVAW
jgi:hypothetical protein